MKNIKYFYYQILLDKNIFNILISGPSKFEELKELNFLFDKIQQNKLFILQFLKIPLTLLLFYNILCNFQPRIKFDMIFNRSPNHNQNSQKYQQNQNSKIIRSNKPTQHQKNQY